MPYPTSPARYLAPIALLAAVLAIVLVIQSTTSNSGTISAPATTSKSASHKPAPKLKHKTYVVKHGDTLSGIAEKTGVSLQTLQTLNDEKAVQTLRIGQRIKLAR